MLDSRQQAQEDAYEFPYHYICTMDPFSCVRADTWGVQYMAFANHLIERLQKMRFLSIADIGCGDGRLLSEISKRIKGVQVTGIDYSNRAIALANALNPGLEFISRDISELANEGRRYDIVTLIEVLEHVPPESRKEFVTSLSKLVNPEGLIIISVPHLNRPPDERHYQHFDLKALSAALAPQLEIIEATFVEPVSPPFALGLAMRLLANRFFSIAHPKFQQKIFDWYKRNFVVSMESACYRIVVLARVKDRSPSAL
jgi:SAM-dependent methyltransferase